MSKVNQYVEGARITPGRPGYKAHAIAVVSRINCVRADILCVNGTGAIRLNNALLHTVEGNSYPLSKQTILGKSSLVSTCLF